MSRDYDRDDDRDRERYDDRDRDYGRDRYDDRDSPEDDIAEAKRKVKLPGMFLIIVGVLYLLAALASLGYGLWSLNTQWDQAVQQAQAQQQQRNPQAAQASQDIMKEMKPVMMVITGVIHGGGALLSLFVIFGGTKMLGLSSRGWGMTAAIIAILPLNCYVWPLGIGMGIWALVALSNDVVKRGFVANRRG